MTLCMEKFITVRRITKMLRVLIESYSITICFIIVGDRQSWLLGEFGYPQQPWLTTLVLNAEEGTPELYYNLRHMSARNCIERCNGVLKSRLRCLLLERKLRYSPVRVNNIAASYTVLHNICTAGLIEYNVM